MTDRRRVGLSAAVATVLAVAALSMGAADTQDRSAVGQGGIPTALEGVSFEEGEYHLSVVCGACHSDIYRAWKDSVHADAYRDPVFQKGLGEAVALGGAGTSELCLTCHAPAILAVDVAGSNDLRLREGVGCDFCHSMTGADLERFPPFELELGKVKYGPLGDARSPIHDTEYSEFMETSAFCATCHEYRSEAGAPVLTTFSEYGEGPYSHRLVACQDCHMPLVLGKTVEERIRDTDRIGFVGFHAITGGHEIGRLRRAVQVELVQATRGSGSVTVQVRIDNRAAGHWLPTGMPTRRLRLEIATRSGDEIHRQETVFGRDILDSEGRRLRSVASMILRGASVTNDTRLRPGETRLIEETLPLPERRQGTLSIRLTYESIETPDEPPVTEDIVHIERTM